MRRRESESGRLAFGQRVRALRRARRLTLDELSSRVGVSLRSLQSWERGERVPHPYTMTQLAKVLGVTVASLTSEDDPVLTTETFGQRVARLRKLRGMTQADVGDRLYVSHSAVARWERDDAPPKMYRLIELAKVLDVSVHYLITGGTVDECQDQKLSG